MIDNSGHTNQEDDDVKLDWLALNKRGKRVSMQTINNLIKNMTFYKRKLTRFINNQFAKKKMNYHHENIPQK